MVNFFRLSLLLLIFSSCSARKSIQDPVLENGVDRSLAKYRKAVLSDIVYQLDFNIPEQKSAPINAHEVLTFSLLSTRFPIQLDFKEDPRKIRSLSLNGKTISVNHTKEHLILQQEFLQKGKNTVKIDFQAGEGALNRNTDYLYTLFVPDRARTVFPCFDQPDLKSVYNLSLQLPVSWTALANAELRDSTLQGQRKTYQYKKSDLLSTYLFAFAAGKFNRFVPAKGLTAQPTEFLYRETDKVKIDLSLPAVFAIHAAALKYYENWTGIKYPFQKFGFAAIPDFQFGGMEHPGAIQYKASSLFLDAGATKDQLNGRNNLIAHETAHMWFGDLVTMDWFTDVWMKEVFANFMADKSSEESGGNNSYALKFLIDHFPAAYAVDRTEGANPIRQPLDNLKDAGTLYGNIIYHKAPLMMQQLEMLMGKNQFQQGIREYLRKFSNSNASWPDLIRILDKYTPANLQSWNKVWVNESGRPLIDYKINYQKVMNNSAKMVINSFSISQKAEYGAARIWPQAFQIALFYPDTVKVLKADLKGSNLDLIEARGLPKPDFILFNSGGEGYGQFPVHPDITSYTSHLKDPLHRATAFIALYEQMLSGQSIKPAALLHLYASALAAEKEELNLRLLSGYISSIYWQFSTAADRLSLAPSLESQIWTAMQIQNAANHKKQLFNAYQNIFQTETARKKIYQIWKTQQPPAGITLSEDDYTGMAFALALRSDEDKNILQQQEARISNPDRKARFQFITPSLSADISVRDAFFKSLGLQANRSKESNVLSALYYLHHPLRQQSSIAYLPKSLEMLQEIQTTGDIFFPQSWLQAILGTYQSKAAADIVRTFIQQHPQYNPKLKAKILQTADNLFRAESLLK
jgi:aminopeptidase N